MNFSKKFAVLGLSLGMAASVNAADLLIDGASSGWVNGNGEITESHTLTADHVYALEGSVYVDNSATITIQAGTVIKSTAGLNGTLIITRDSKIYALGTASKPIIFTSSNDTGLTTERSAVGEWGNLTIEGKALIGAEYNANGSAIRQYTLGSTTYNNSAYPTGVNLAQMEGLTAVAGSDRNLFGGDNDDDDSGTLAYVSLRYGGYKSSIDNAELNGLSMGGIGRNTDVHHIDIFCNLDDGIETWGGTVNYKYVSIWYEGDDAFDVDEGWRGKAQFGLIVQGFGTTTGSQGSGISDNCFETDGAESNISVPTTTATIYNFTVIGQPDKQVTAPIPSTGSDYGMAFRDNARVQYRNMIFMDIGQNVLVEERSETGSTDNSYNWRYGQGAQSPYNTTPHFDNTSTGVWGLPYNAAYDTAADVSGKAAGHANNKGYLSALHPGDAGFPGSLVAMSMAQLHELYPVQTSGTLCEVSETLFYDCLWNSGANTAFNNNNFSGDTSNVGTDDLGITASGASAGTNVVQTRVGNPTLPIQKLQRGSVTTLTGTLAMAKIAPQGLDPRRNPANAATVAATAAPDDGFFTPAYYKGGFSSDNNWAAGWTAASAYQLFDSAATSSVSAPAATVMAFGTSFMTEAGKKYQVETSTDGVNWTPMQPTSVVNGNGSVYTISPLAPNTLYRVTTITD